MKVFVYFNLHKKVWSLKARGGAKNARVLAHADHVQLKNVEFKVSEAGRQRVLAEKQKNVHAGLVGELVDLEGDLTEAGRAAGLAELAGNVEPLDGDRISYNPYKHPWFFRISDTQPAQKASAVSMHADTRAVIAHLIETTPVAA